MKNTCLFRYEMQSNSGQKEAEKNCLQNLHIPAVEMRVSDCKKDVVIEKLKKLDLIREERN